MKYLLLILSIISMSAFAKERVALIIGNGGYNKNSNGLELEYLSNPVNDAKDMAEVLGSLGFEVILIVDADKKAMKNAVREFGKRLGNFRNQTDVGLFYYSGHGFQHNKVNYLVPLRVDIQHEVDIEDEALRADYALRFMKSENKGVNIVILDTCRSNIPKNVLRQNKGFFDDLESGLAEMKAPANSLIAYATEPNTDSLSGFAGERNSLYTKHLLAKLRTMPHLNILEVFVAVRDQVMQETKNEKIQQVPWESVSLRKKVCFGECEQVTSITTQINSSEKNMIPDVKGKWFQTHSNAGDCFQCFITITFIDTKTIRVVSNNGWTGVADYDSEFDEFNGKLKWNDNAGGVYAGIKMDMQIYKHDIWLEVKARKDFRRFDSTYATLTEIEKNTRNGNNFHYSKPTTQPLSVISNAIKLPIPTHEWKTIKAHKGGGEGAICHGDCLDFSPDGQFILSGSWDKNNALKLFHINTGKLVRVFKGHSDRVIAVAFSNDGQRALSGSNDETINLWNISTGQIVCTLKGHDSFVYSVAFSPSGKMALSGADFPDKTMKLWNLSTCKLIRTFAVNADSVHSVVFSPDGQRALSGSLREIKLWNLSTGQLIRTFKGHSTLVNSIAFSPNGQKVLSGSDVFSGRNGETIKLWNLNTGKIIHNFEHFSEHSGSVSSVAFSSDGRFIASGSSDKMVKLWDVSSGKLIRTLKGHTSWINSIAFSSDGTLASGDYNGVIKLWR